MLCLVVSFACGFLFEVSISPQCGYITPDKGGGLIGVSTSPPPKKGFVVYFVGFGLSESLYQTPNPGGGQVTSDTRGGLVDNSASPPPNRECRERPRRRSMIAEAGLSSFGLIERNDLLRVATEPRPRLIAIVGPTLSIKNTILFFWYSTEYLCFRNFFEFCF